MTTVNLTRVPNKGRPATAVSMNASAVLATYYVERMAGYSICASIDETTASLAGTLTLQASNNAFLDDGNNTTNPDAVWVDIASSDVTLTSGDTTTMWNVSDSYYEAVRVSWTRTTGQGTFTAYFVAKGV